MFDFQHLLKYWPVFLTTVGGLALAIAAIRYRIPDLVKRIEMIENLKRPSTQDHEELVRRVEIVESESARHPSTKDLEKTISNFQTICKFNQVTCQKGTEKAIHKVRQDIDDKLSALYELFNKQAVVIARVDERIAALHDRQSAINNG